jgi:hypothetical protein
LKRPSLAMCLLIGWSALFALYLAWLNGGGADRVSEPLHHAYLAVLAVGVLGSLVAERIRWANDQAEARVRDANYRTLWLDNRAEQRSRNEIAWHQERTQAQPKLSIVYPPSHRHSKQPKSTMATFPTAEQLRVDWSREDPEATGDITARKDTA